MQKGHKELAGLLEQLDLGCDSDYKQVSTLMTTH